MANPPDIGAMMERIKKRGPSWKTDVTLHRSASGSEPWEARLHDIWGHIHSPVFTGKTPHGVLIALETWQRWMIADYNDAEPPWLDDDDNWRGSFEGLAWIHPRSDEVSASEFVLPSHAQLAPMMLEDQQPGGGG